MATVYKVSQLLERVKGALEEDFGAVAVEGEASGVKAYPSGHVYFSLKDEHAVLNCVLWASIASRLPFKLEEGRVFLCAGKLTVYPPSGRFQMEVRKVEPAGLGALKLALDQLRKKLAAEGLFEPDRKKGMPVLPLRIGVVTSPEGAALQDFYKVLRGSPLDYEVRVHPSQVQGRTAAAEVRAGLAHFQWHRPDLVVITRGGGSFEDLMPFNDEGLVRAVAASAVPVISAVGHEVDFTLCDEAADLRCPTPTAAAAWIVERHAEAVQRYDGAREALTEGMEERLEELERSLREFRQRFSPRGMEAFIEHMGQRLLAYAARLSSGARDRLRDRGQALERGRMALFRRAVLLAPALEARVGKARTALEALPARLERRGERLAFLKKGLTHLSVRETLRRGYAVLTRADRTAVRSESEVAVGETVEAMLYDGGLTCQVREKKRN
jgi:exodeoxyribonuclease VII large subunit